MLRMWVLLGLLTMAGCAGERAVSFRSAAPEGVPADTIRAQLFKPEGNGPFPAVLLVHGCSGINRHYDNWARRLVDWGYVALIVDSLGPRGIQSVCTQPGAVPPSQRARDAFGAAAYLRDQPFVHGDRIGVIGFSHGGWTAMRLVQPEAPRDVAAPPFQAAVAYYPWCDAPTQSRVEVPTLILIGELDDWTPAGRCRGLQAALRKPELVSMTVYPNAYHGYDAEGGIRFTLGSDGKMHRAEPDREAAADSFAKTRAFLDKHLKP
jgi:dienelactone hydrolase